MPNDDLIIQALGGKPGDKLIRNPDGSAVLQPGEPQAPAGINMLQQAANVAAEATGLGTVAKSAASIADLFPGGDKVSNYLKAGMFGAREAAIPAGGAMLGGMAGAKIPGPPIVKILGGLVGSVAGGMGTGALQTKAQEVMAPELKAEYEAAAQNYPWSTRIGGLIPSVATGRFGLDNINSVARLARNSARTSIPLAMREGVASGDVANAINAAAGVGLPATAAYRQYAATGKIDPSAILDVAAGVGQTGFNKPLSRALGIPYGPAYHAQTGEQLRRGLDVQAPLNVDTTVAGPNDIPLAEGVSPDAAELGYSDADKLAADMAKGAEKTRKQERQALVKDAQQRFDYADKVGPGPSIDYATRLNNTVVDLLRNPGVKPDAVQAILNNDKLNDAERLAQLTGLVNPTQPQAHTPIVPDNPATVTQQLELTLDKNSARKAVLYTHGTKLPKLPLGLERMETPHGIVDYNPAKISAQEIYKGSHGPDFDARVLGMSQSAKPGDPEAVAVTSSRRGQPNVQAEAAAGEGIPGAVAAAEKANPGEPVEIKPPQQVLDERTAPTADERKIYQQELDDANRSEGGYGEKEISDIVGDKRPQLLGGVSNTLKAQGRKVDVIPSDKPYTTPEDSTPRYGMQRGDKVEYGTTAHAAPHEAVHAIYEGLPERERARLDDAITRSEEYQKAQQDDPELTPQEFLAQRGAVNLVKQIQEKDFGLWKDLAMQARRMFNLDTPQDAMRFVANAFTSGADRPGGALNVASPKPVQRPTGPAGTYQRFPEAESNRENPIPKADAPQADAEAKTNFSKAEGVFATELEKQARTSKPWGLLPNNAGKYSAEGLIAKFRMQGKVEQSLLPGFEDWVKRNGGATKEELIQYAKENEPKAEVHTYGMDREQSEAKKELDKLTHEWYDNLDGGSQRILARVSPVHTGNPTAEDRLWIDKELSQLSAKNYNKAQRYLDLAKQVLDEPYDNSGPVATHYYNSISPKEVNRPMPDWTVSKSKKNLQRVDVVLPHQDTVEVSNASGLDQFGKSYRHNDPLWHQDDLHENMPNTLGWAAIQYETGPNGEKIAHVIEAQSRWGQERRKRESNIEVRQDRDGRWILWDRKDNNYENGAERDPTRYRNTTKEDAKIRKEQIISGRIGIPDHPLLADYNRLILKAAIEQARKEGATHIAISDAETAMMTEMHDQSARMVETLPVEQFARPYELAKGKGSLAYNFGEDWANGSYVRVKTEHGGKLTLRVDKPEANAESNRELAQELADAGYGKPGRSEHYVSQEPGMRFNYDGRKGQLHKIAQEITRSPGEGVSFGEHKNAFTRREGFEEGAMIVGEDEARPYWNDPNYSVEPHGNDEYLVKSRRSGTPREDLIFRNPDGTPKTTATGRLYPIANPAARRTAGEPFSYGRANYSAPKLPKDFRTSDVRGFDLISKIDDPALRQSANEAQAEKSRLLGYGYKAVRDNREALKTANLDAMADAYNKKQQPLTDTASQAVYKMFADAADWINKNNPARQIIKKPGYVPQMFHPDVRQVFKESANSPDANAIKAQLVAHYQRAMTRDAAIKAVDELAQAIHTNPSYDPSTDFGPLHKAAGLGLPAEVAAPSGVIRIRDNDMMRVAQTYFGRAATDLAYHNAITKRFGANGGNESDSAFQRWRQSFTGQPESDADQLFRSSMRAGSSVVVSTLSGLNNIASIPQQAMAFTGKYGPFTTAAALIDTITSPRASHEASIAAGHTRPGQNDMTFKQTRDTNLAAAVLDASADTMRLVTGSTALENISRAWTYNIGKRAARNMIDAGDHDKMLRLGVQPNDPKAEEKLAASIANHIEGTYDGRELPGPLVEGKLGALLSIHKWSIEKMNSAYKDLYVPATKGDLWPLLWTVAMAAGVTIPAAKELKEAVNRKKGAPELEEINAAEKVTGKKDWLARTAWLTQLLSMASIAGYASQAANAATQTAAGRKDQNLVFVPLSELAGEELSNLVGNASQALRKGEDLDTIGPQFAKDLLKIMVQGSQAVLNRLPGQEANVQAASDNRDLAVYNNLVNKKMPSEARANDLDGALEREFKKEQDPAKARELLEKIVTRYKEKYKDDPFMLNAKIRSLREMNGIGWPTEGNEAGRYKQYSDDAYGEEATKEKLKRAAYRDALNQGKVKAMDEAGIKPAKAEPNPFRK